VWRGEEKAANTSEFAVDPLPFNDFLDHVYCTGMALKRLPGAILTEDIFNCVVSVIQGKGEMGSGTRTLSGRKNAGFEHRHRKSLPSE
jgi:hypothetical protein